MITRTDRLGKVWVLLHEDAQLAKRGDVVYFCTVPSVERARELTGECDGTMVEVVSLEPDENGEPFFNVADDYDLHWREL